MAEKRGKPFERLVAALLMRLEPGAEVTHDEHVIGKATERPRQIDVAVRGKIGPSKLLIVFECRELKKKIKPRAMEAFVTALKDVGADKGIMVTTVGYEAGALALAQHARIDACVLRPAQDEDWEGYLRDIQVELVSRGTVYRDCKVRLKDGREFGVSQVTMFRRPNDEKNIFFDHILNYALDQADWEEDRVTIVTLTEPLVLCRDEVPEPEVEALICRPRTEDLFSTGPLLWRVPEDWVFFKMLPHGQIEEKQFFEFKELDKVAAQFK